jgi:hypothetical protein
MKIEGESGHVLLPGNTTINSIVLDRVNDIIILDLSDNDNITTEERLQPLADTLGQFYGTRKVRPTVNGKDYILGEKTYGPSDYITVVLEDDQLAVS